MNFYVASRGVAINFQIDFSAGGGGVMFKMFQYNNLKDFLARFAHSCFILLFLIFSLFSAFIFSSATVILFWCFIVIIILILIEN